jgi:uncharacterized protein YecE (DUF72 family)
MADLRIGTCSWKFPSWAGLVYSAPKGIDYLAEYARGYDTVEVDQWFWSLFGVDKVKLPVARDVEAYRAVVPDDFRFTVKAPNSITLTHFYQRDKSRPLEANPYFLSRPLTEAFLATLEPLADVLGPVMFQFEYLNRRKMAGQGRFEALFGAFAEQLPPGRAYGIETRNGNYVNRDYFTFVAAHGLIPVLLEGYWMPPIVELYRRWGELIRRPGQVVIRLLGPDRQGIEERTGKRWDRIVAPRDEALDDIAAMVQDLLAHGVDVYVNVNNHYEGSAPRTIERLRQRL